ncbi:exo-beta-N-acetylmuramidase NamZ domain-containing protein [Gluconacetobacter sacchari]|uniref:exo-beta-N-acetylmuramidase NamZ family protein n=1 Tax=Gluconacetobacter sacchari TaxID=92759 RepID=UPI0039B4D694
MTPPRRTVLAGLASTLASTLAATVAATRARADAPCAPPVPARVATGFDRLRADGYRLLAGHRVGLVANPTSVDRALCHIADLLHAEPTVRLAAIFGPEHGFRGSAPAGASEARTTDPATGITVFDIYDKAGAPLDRILRESGIDLLLFDIQDIGARFYTYAWTLHDVMQSCARLAIPVIVLDRPNPIGAVAPSGPVLQPAFASFVGRAPIALRHAMTMGELALFFHRYSLAAPAAPPRVVAMRGWSRALFYDQTGLPWVAPSPNMPTLDTALAYPGTCLFEGTVLSVGRGTAQPFLQLGGPEVDARPWVAALRQAGLPGVLFRETWFTPSAQVDRDRLVHGLDLVVTDRRRFDPVATGLALLHTARPLCRGAFWRADGHMFDLLCGTDAIRHAIDAGTGPATIAAGWQAGLAAFARRRRDVLLYRS